MLEWFKKQVESSTTKKLTWLVALAWVSTVIMSFIAVILWSADVSFILMSVSGTFAIVLPSYLIKSYNENVQKYSNVQGAIVDGVEKIIEKVKGE